jgi:hypothetical protein
MPDESRITPAVIASVAVLPENPCKYSRGQATEPVPVQDPLSVSSTGGCGASRYLQR